MLSREHLSITLALPMFWLMLSGCGRPTVQRYGSVIGLREDKIEKYRELHANAWPGVLKKLKECNIRNYSIYLHKMDDGRHYLFGYFEYKGENFEKDVARLAEDETTKRWWKQTDPCQFPLENRKEGEWWASMEQVFHSD
ncbi:MAG: L-rhamnose mutarotase [Planctomycetota bacterium]|jgi:L-rhamnose mutarotase